MLWTLLSTYHPGSVSESCHQSNCHVEALDTRQLHPETAARHPHLSVPSGAAFTHRWAALPVATGSCQTWPLSANVFHTRCLTWPFSHFSLFFIVSCLCVFNVAFLPDTQRRMGLIENFEAMQSWRLRSLLPYLVNICLNNWASSHDSWAASCQHTAQLPRSSLSVTSLLQSY